MNAQTKMLGVSKLESQTIHKIASRAVAEFGGNIVDWEMDVTAVHANGCPLKLDDLLMADGFNFAHDLCGIRRHIDRTTGRLGDCFCPRFSA